MKKIGCHKNRRIFGQFHHTNTNTCSHVPDFRLAAVSANTHRSGLTGQSLTPIQGFCQRKLNRYISQHTLFRLDRPKPDVNPRFSSKENSIHTQSGKLTTALPPINHHHAHNTLRFTSRKPQKNIARLNRRANKKTRGYRNMKV